MYSILLYENSQQELFNWMSPENLKWALFLGLVPGVIAHQIANFTVKYIDPITLATFWNLEPFVGILIGMFFGVQGMPNSTIWIGGCLSCASVFGVSLIEMKESDSEKEPGLPLGDKELDYLATDSRSTKMKV